MYGISFISPSYPSPKQKDSYVFYAGQGGTCIFLFVFGQGTGLVLADQ